MTLKLKDIDIRAKLPRIKTAMSVFEIKSPTLDERQPAIELFRETLGFGELKSAETKDSIHFVSKEGEIQFYKPSGALWVNSFMQEEKYEDERRSWKVTEVKDNEDPEDVNLVLNERDQKILLRQASSLFKESELIREAHFAGVDLTQVAKLDEKGREIARYPGEATVKFLYKLDDIAVDGPGAKTFAFFNPGRRKHDLSGLFHCWRDVAGSRRIKMPGIEETLEKAISTDRELLIYHKRGYKFSIRSIELVYYTLPPYKNQQFSFPTLHVIGAAIPQENKKEGFEFTRFYNAAPAKIYAKANIFADYLVGRL